MSEYAKNIIIYIVVFIILFLTISKGVDWWTHYKLIQESDKKVSFSIQNNDLNKCSIISDAISVAINLTDQNALDHYKNIFKENSCPSPEDANLEKTNAYLKKQSSPSIKDTIGYKLVSIAENGKAISIDDPRISALNGKLEYLSHQTGMSEAEIADMSYFLEKELKKHKRKSDIDEVLEVIFIGIENHACNLKSPTTRDCIVNFLGTYATTRINTNQDHQTAIQSLKSILNVVNNPEKKEKLEEIINSNKN